MDATMEQILDLLMAWKMRAIQLDEKLKIANARIEKLEEKPNVVPKSNGNKKRGI